MTILSQALTATVRAVAAKKRLIPQKRALVLVSSLVLQQPYFKTGSQDMLNILSYIYAFAYELQRMYSYIIIWVSSFHFIDTSCCWQS